MKFSVYLSKNWKVNLNVSLLSVKFKAMQLSDLSFNVIYHTKQ